MLRLFFSSFIAVTVLVCLVSAQSEPTAADGPIATLGFDEILVLPVGPKGWELTEKARALDGRRVQLTGHMVRELNPDPDLFLVAASPVTTYACESLAASDVPPNAVQVMLAPRPGLGVTWRPQQLTVIGRLELGHREERDGRVSHVRLVAEQVLAADTGEPVDLHLPLARRALGSTSRP
ncbi:MAG: hypothetical protein IAE82_03115 [Opitutaceae bacterium]|nr:hypothetical protein [Opitutaceae bacterium]